MTHYESWDYGDDLTEEPPLEKRYCCCAQRRIAESLASKRARNMVEALRTATVHEEPAHDEMNDRCWCNPDIVTYPSGGQLIVHKRLQ